VQALNTLQGKNGQIEQDIEELRSAVQNADEDKPDADFVAERVME